jgi:branched-chain amino acid transport system substrate-binding protein
MFDRIIRLPAILALLSLALIAVVSACSSSGDSTTSPTGTGASGSSPAVSKVPYKFAYIMDFSGPISPFLNSLFPGLDTYIKQVNDKGGVNGRQINLVSEDDQGNAETDLGLFRRYVADDPTIAIIGLTLSSFLVAAMDELGSTQMAVISPSNTVPSLLAKGDNRLFATSLDYPDQAGLILKNLIASKGTSVKVAMCEVDTAAGHEAMDIAQQQFSQLGLQWLTGQFFKTGNSDLTAQMLAYRDAKPDYIVCASGSQTQMKLVNDNIHTLGLNAQLVAGWPGGDRSVFDAIRDPNYFALRNYADPLDNVDGASEMRDAAAKYSTASFMNQNYFTEGWVLGHAIEQALLKCPGDCSRPDFITALRSIKDLKVGDLSGTMDFSDPYSYAARFARVYGWDSTLKAAKAETGWIQLTGPAVPSSGSPVASGSTASATAAATSH